MTPLQQHRAALYAAKSGAYLVRRIIELEQELEDLDPFSGTEANCPSCGATLCGPTPIDMGDGPFFPEDYDTVFNFTKGG
jgi:hypothetical protein